MLIAIEPLLVLFFLHSIEMSTFISRFYQTNGIAQWLLLLLEKLFQSVFKPIFLAKLNNRMIGFSICVLIFFLFFLIKFSNTLRFQLLNTWWIFTMFTNWIYNVNLIDDEFFICQATYKRDDTHYSRLFIWCMWVCWTYESIDFYVVSAAAARLDDIKCVAPIFNGISLLFFLACFLVAPDGSEKEWVGKCLFTFRWLCSLGNKWKLDLTFW